MARRLCVGEENIRTSSGHAGGLVFPGEPVLYSRRKLWIRMSSAATQRKRHVVPEEISEHDSVILPAVSPPAIVESPEHKGLELPPVPQAAYAAISDFWPDRTDRSSGRLDDWMPGSEPEGAIEEIKHYDGLLGEAHLCDLVMQKLKQTLRVPSIRGVSVDLRMVGVGETMDYLRFLRRVRRAVGRNRRVIASVPGEWFCRDRLRRSIFRAAVAGFAVEDMLELVDAVVVRCWRDPVFSDAGEGSLTSIGFIRQAVAAAAKAVPRWKLAAGFMCGAVIRHEADTIREDYIAAQHLEELTQRFVVRRRYTPDEDSLRAYLVSRKLKCDFWSEDSRTLPKRLALVNRNNLLGVELFWPGLQGSLVETCRRRFEPLQEFEGSWLNTSTEENPSDG